jgi:hypothetical protein
MVTGQCLCGNVRFEIDGDLGETRLCYCTLCRRANGSAFSANVAVSIERYRLRSGREDIREYESSPGAFRAFCSRCGSPVSARVLSDPACIRIRLGTLEKEASAKSWRTLGWVLSRTGIRSPMFFLNMRRLSEPKRWTEHNQEFRAFRRDCEKSVRYSSRARSGRVIAAAADNHLSSVCSSPSKKGSPPSQAETA